MINLKLQSNSFFSNLNFQQQQQNIFPILVTGLGGSGTHFIASNLTSMFDIDVAHEMIRSDGSIVILTFYLLFVNHSFFYTLKKFAYIYL